MNKSVVNIGGQNYEVEVKNGIRYIDGKTVDEFLETLDTETLLKASRVGKMAIDDEIKGVTPAKGKYQYYINEPL